MKSIIKFTAQNRFSTLQAAVDAVKPDYSYNPQIAAQRIADADRGHRLVEPTEFAFLDGSDIYRVYRTKDGLRLVAKFEPFFGAVDDSPWTACTCDENGITQHDEVKLPKSERATIANLLRQAPTLCLA